MTGSFSPEQLAQYKTFLGFFTSEQRIQVAELLMVEDDINLLWMEDWLKEFVGSIAEQDRSKSPSSTRSEALRWANTLHSTVRKLIHLVEEDEKLGFLLAPSLTPDQAVKSLSDPEIAKAQCNARADNAANFLHNLERLRDSSAELLDDGSQLRRHLNLGRAPKGWLVSMLLWPVLFRIWTDAGQHVAHTEDGPLHRFLQIVHCAGGLHAPRHGTFKDAVHRWRSEGPKQTFGMFLPRFFDHGGKRA